MREMIFAVGQEGDGGFTAEALGENIFTQAETWEALRENVRDAILAYRFDAPAPQSMRLRLVRDEVLVTA